MSNITLTDDLRNHVNAICAKSKAWAEAAPEGEFRGYSSYDEQDIIFYCEHYTKGERCLTPKEWDQTILLLQKKNLRSLLETSSRMLPIPLRNCDIIVV